MTPSTSPRSESIARPAPASPASEPAPTAVPVVPPPASQPPSGNDGLHLVRGRTMREALLDARRSLGARSIVVDHVTRPGVAGVPGEVVLAVSTAVPRSTDALARLKERAAALLAGDATQPSTARPPLVPRRSGRSPLADVERRLREQGASKALRERILEGIVASGEDDAHPLDLAAIEVAKAFGVAHLPFQAGQLCVLAVLGQTGAGKTTTLAKLSAKLVRAGRRVAIATLDVHRVGAVGELQAYGKQLGVAAIALTDVDRFAAAVARDTRFDVILIDGSGDLERDTEAIRALRERLDPREAGGLEELAGDGRTRVDVLATLPASASRAALSAVIDALAPFEPVGAIVTKIDETREPLPACEIAAGAGLDVAFLTNGPDVQKHLIRASAERFADIALTGRSLAEPTLGEKRIARTEAAR